MDLRRGVGEAPLEGGAEVADGGEEKQFGVLFISAGEEVEGALGGDIGPGHARFHGGGGAVNGRGVGKEGGKGGSGVLHEPV